MYEAWVAVTTLVSPRSSWIGHQHQVSGGEMQTLLSRIQQYPYLGFQSNPSETQYALELLTPICIITTGNKTKILTALPRPQGRTNQVTAADHTDWYQLPTAPRSPR